MAFVGSGERTRKWVNCLISAAEIRSAFFSRSPAIFRPRRSEM
ncbi:MAG: hypothetical protein MPW15_09975 [Candidatus Manganitrophus sp.]|nr:hypothetical protein [Candidatus Manganitrophus sp.]